MPHKIEKIEDRFGVLYVGYDENGNILIHNEDGPAVIWADGSKSWYINDRLVTEEVEKWCQERNLNINNLSEEDQLALSFYMRSL